MLRKRSGASSSQALRAYPGLEVGYFRDSGWWLPNAVTRAQRLEVPQHFRIWGVRGAGFHAIGRSAALGKKALGTAFVMSRSHAAVKSTALVGNQIASCLKMWPLLGVSGSSYCLQCWQPWRLLSDGTWISASRFVFDLLYAAMIQVAQVLQAA